MNFVKNGHGHMTKMAATPVYGKKLLKLFFFRIGSPMILKLGRQHWRLTPNKVYINGDPRLTLTYFTARSKMVDFAFKWEKCFKVIEWG